MEMTAGRKMALVSALYKTETRILTPTGNGTLVVLQRDPRRFYVEFRPCVTTQYPIIYPGGLPAGAVSGSLTDAHDKYKYHDCPGIVTGEFVMIADGAVGSVLIITDTYIGE